MPTPLRVGVLGTAVISGKVRRAIVAAGLRVAAIASRDLARAEAWAADALASGDVPGEAVVAFDSYDALIASPDIDAVYVPLPCGLHREWVLKCAAAGKHVVVEKPCAVSVAVLEDMVAACREHNVTFLDNTMFHHHPRMAALGDVIFDAARFGAVAHVSSSFSFRGDAAFFSGNIVRGGKQEIPRARGAP
jgi:predicted dehydrogenase